LAATTHDNERGVDANPQLAILHQDQKWLVVTPMLGREPSCSADTLDLGSPSDQQQLNWPDQKLSQSPLPC
jgi:hypothetical protein